MKHCEMHEFAVIDKYFSAKFSPQASSEASVILGVGDDAGLVQPSTNTELAISVDTLVVDVHFPATSPAEKIAQRALRVCLSDLAAMGARPKWFTLALTLPKIDESWLAEFSDALAVAADHFSCVLIGGDTTQGPLSMTLQVMGEVQKGQGLRRSGAMPGDKIYVSGSLGDAAAALAIMQSRVSVSDEDKPFLLDRFYEPEPRFGPAKKIQTIASSAIDISDGLLADLTHICRASQVGALIDVASLPYSDALRRCTTENQRQEWALTGGDDYELCFTATEKNSKLIDADDGEWHAPRYANWQDYRGSRGVVL